MDQGHVDSRQQWGDQAEYKRAVHPHHAEAWHRAQNQAQPYRQQAADCSAASGGEEGGPGSFHGRVTRGQRVELVGLTRRGLAPR